MITYLPLTGQIPFCSDPGILLLFSYFLFFLQQKSMVLSQNSMVLLCKSIYTQGTSK